jgi:hypothetical protein
MPMHPSWEKIQENFKQQYGDRWEEVFWAWMNEHGYDETKPAEGQIKGEECKKEEENKERPPKDWFDKCVESVSKNPDVEDPEALCVLPDTEILMADFTKKPIKEIKEGEYVIGGIELKPQKVIKVHKRMYKGQIVRIGRKDGQNVFLTPEHPVLTKNGFKRAIDLNCRIDKVAKIRYANNLGKSFGNPKHNLIVKQLGEILTAKGFRYIPISGSGIVPDAIAIKDNKVYAIEVEQNAPDIEKYAQPHEYDDVFWFIKQEALGKITHRGSVKEGIRVLKDFPTRKYFVSLINGRINKRSIEYEGEVYNLTTEGDNTYIANGYVVHNCSWIWYHGKKEKLSEEDVKKLNEEFKKESGEEMVIEYLEQLIKEMEEALDELEDAIEKKRISELPTT